MSMQIDFTHTTDLAREMTLEHMPTLLFTGDEQAHRFAVTVVRGAEKLSLSGATITGFFIRGDGATHELAGTVDSDGRAVVTLDKFCYAASGRVQLAIRAQQGEVKTIIFAAEGGMHRVTTDSIVDTGHVVPSIEELLAQLDAIDAATEAALAAADKANSAVGPTPNLTIGTVTTLPAGSQATATITGTPEDPVLNLGIPRGVDGDDADGAVQSVNGKTGAVTLAAADVGALPISGGTLTGAQAVNVACVRNIYAGTEALETGVSALETGVIYIQYE